MQRTETLDCERSKVNISTTCFICICGISFVAFVHSKLIKMQILLTRTQIIIQATIVSRKSEKSFFRCRGHEMYTTKGFAGCRFDWDEWAQLISRYQEKYFSTLSWSMIFLIDVIIFTIMHSEHLSRAARVKTTYVSILCIIHDMDLDLVLFSGK